MYTESVFELFSTLVTTLHQHELLADAWQTGKNFWLIHDRLLITLNNAIFWDTLNENSLGLGTTSSYGDMKVSTLKHQQHQMDKSMQKRYADKSPFNIVDYSAADPCKNCITNSANQSLEQKNFHFLCNFPPWQTPRSPASYQEGRTSKSCARHRNVWGSQDGGGGLTCYNLLSLWRLTVWSTLKTLSPVRERKRRYGQQQQQQQTNDKVWEEIIPTHPRINVAEAKETLLFSFYNCCDLRNRKIK